MVKKNITPNKRHPRYSKTNLPGLIRDNASGAILNTNVAEAAAYKKRRAAALQQKTEMQTLKDEVAKLQALVQKLIKD